MLEFQTPQSSNPEGYQWSGEERRKTDGATSDLAGKSIAKRALEQGFLSDDPTDENGQLHEKRIVFVRADDLQNDALKSTVLEILNTVKDARNRMSRELHYVEDHGQGNDKDEELTWAPVHLKFDDLGFSSETTAPPEQGSATIDPDYNNLHHWLKYIDDMPDLSWVNRGLEEALR